MRTNRIGISFVIVIQLEPMRTCLIFLKDTFSIYYKIIGLDFFVHLCVCLIVLFYDLI